MFSGKYKKGVWLPLQHVGWSVLFCSLILVLSVAGCGGGGGGGGDTDDTESTYSDTTGSVDDGGDDAAVTTGSAPEAAFTVSTDIGSFPLKVTFDASDTTDADGGTIEYDWDFGDDATDDGVSATHTYTAPGTYTAALTATDETGLTGTATQVIDVKPLFSISGTMTPADYVVSDSDVNDPNKVSTANDDFASAQEVYAPCSISGYVNEAETGAVGRSYDTGDPYDVYKVTLAGGMHITLYMAEDPTSADLNLTLYDADTGWVDESLSSTSSVESLTATADGEYYVEVSAETSASAYVLTIGFSSPAAASSTLRLSDAFVPGEVLVRFEGEDGDAVSNLAGEPGKVSPMGFFTRADDRDRDRLLRRSETVDRSTFFSRLGVQSALDRRLSRGRIDAATRAKLETLYMVRAVAQQPGVEAAQPNYILKAMATEPDDPLYTRQWHYPLINLPDAWDISTGSGDVTVAVIDTGVLLAHPDLADQVVAGYDFVDGDDDPTDEHTLHHGTHVAGTVAAASDNGVGVAGVAWNAKIMPLRVLDANGTGTSDDILDAVKYAAGLSAAGGVTLDEPVDVINLSLGGGSLGSVEERAYEDARAQGVIIVAAAGNSQSDDPMYPAAYDSVVSVSAVTISESLAWYSNYGDTIDVAAPGGDSGDENNDGYADKVLSTNGEGSGLDIEYTYELMNGTSMASPHVAGVVALMKSLYPGMTPDEFDSLLQGGYLTRDIGDEGRDDFFGWGLIDAYKAVSVVKDGNIDETLPPILTVSPSVLYFGAALSSMEVAVENSGGGTLALADGSPTWSAAWLEVTASGDVGDDGLGTYVVAVDRTGLSSNSYFDTITFTSTDGTDKDVNVSLLVSTGEESSDTGFYYILLVDSDYETVDQVATGGAGGVYEYTFEDLSYGDSYYIFAGTDPDNDYEICGNGEACGAYMSLDNPVKLKVESDLAGIDFTSDVLFDLSSTALSQGSGDSLSLRRNAAAQDEE